MIFSFFGFIRPKNRETQPPSDTFFSKTFVRLIV